MRKSLTSDELLRAVWTTLGGVAAIIGVVGVAAVLWLLRDAERFAWAAHQVERTGTALITLYADGDVTDMRLLAAKASTTFCTALCAFGAGVAATLGSVTWAIGFLIVLEVLVLMSATLNVFLGLTKRARNQRIREAIRLNRATHGGK